jgi:hypothetical protein
MAYQKPTIREFEVRRVGALMPAPNNSSCLECETSLGMIAFWGDARSMVNIEAIRAASPPFRVRCGCITPRRTVSNHVLWVPQSVPVEITTT